MDYQKKKDTTNNWYHALSKAGRDIFDSFPPIESINWEQRNNCEKNLKLFLETYFSEAFCLPWSVDHLRIIQKLETAILNGGLFAMALPRSSGKTTICERSALWAILYGHRKFVCLIGATQDAAERLLQHIKTELQFNEVLRNDFPTACYPIFRLENNAKRCIGQLYHGEQTLINWTSDKLTLPRIERTDSKSSGSCISCCGLTGNIRGQNHTLPDGKIIRPELLIIDDPQTRESAASYSQTKRRLEILQGDILGLSGVGQTLAAVAPMTVIYRGDLADQLLDRSKFPQWQGERTKLLYSFPVDEKKWDEYRSIREASFRKDHQGEEATEFYRSNQEDMDRGANPAWKERFNRDEISAVQHCMNLLLRDSQAFYAEYQNEPQCSSGDEQELPKPTVIIERINNLKKLVVPEDTQWITGFIDVQESLLYYTLVAFASNFTASVIDWGTFPDQRRTYFTLGEAKNTIQKQFPNAQLQGQLYSALDQCSKFLCDRKYLCEDGTERYIDKLGIDANWGSSKNTVYKFCKESKHTKVLIPLHGRFLGATSKPYSEYRKVSGEFNGPHWRIPKPNKGEVRHLLVDTNYWKSFIFQCLNTAIGDSGALTLWGKDEGLHRMFADQLCAENCVRVQARDRIVDEWKASPSKPDNHFLDCMVGCYAMAGLLGAKILPNPLRSQAKKEKAKQDPKKQRVTYFNL